MAHMAVLLDLWNPNTLSADRSDAERLCPSRKRHLGKDRRRWLGLSCQLAACVGLAALDQSAASLPAGNSSTSTVPPGGGRPKAPCFAQRPAAMLVPRRVVHGDRKRVGEGTWDSFAACGVYSVCFC